MYYEPYQHSGDDTALNGMEVMCRGPGMHGTHIENIDQMINYSASTWSSWSSTCSSGTAVCALRTRVESLQGSGTQYGFDDAALTDAHLYCCEY